MKTLLKYWPLVIFVVVIISVIIFHRDDKTRDRSELIVPSDSTFLPVVKTTYTPPIVRIPGLRRPESSHSPRLPRGVTERDVARIVKLQVRNSNQPVSIIETKDGMVYVAKDSIVTKVEVIDYMPPVARFGIFPGAGLSVLLLDSSACISPMFKLSLVEVYGKVRISALADLKGIGAGAEYAFYHDLAIGAGYFAAYRNIQQRSFKLTLSYNF